MHKKFIEFDLIEIKQNSCVRMYSGRNSAEREREREQEG